MGPERENGQSQQTAQAHDSAAPSHHPLDRAGIDRMVGAPGIGAFPRSGNTRPLTMDVGGESEQFRPEGYRAEMQRLVEQQENVEAEDITRTSKGVAFGFGALVVAAMAAGIWFAYEEGVKEGRRQSPPHVAAPQGSSKAKPADTAKTPVAHQDKAVLDQLQPGGEEKAAETVNKGVELPLAKPERLSDKDLPTIFEEGAGDVAAREEESRKGALEALQALAQWEQNRVERLEQISQAEDGTGEPLGNGERHTLQDLLDEEEDFEALEAPLEDGPVEIATQDSDFAAPAALPDDTLETSVIADKPATAGAPRPLIRPTDIKPVAPAPVANKPVSTSPVVKPAATPKPVSVAATTPSGDVWRIQIGAFGSVEQADKEWTRLGRRYKSVLAGLPKHVEPADVNGKRLYRLKGGQFSSKGAAASLCQKLTAAGGSCLVKKDAR